MFEFWKIMRDLWILINVLNDLISIKDILDGY
jgi:hypothetical protein